MEGRSTRKNYAKGEDELHTMVKSLVTTLCTSEDFISKIATAITENINKQFKQDIQRLVNENVKINKRIQEQSEICDMLARTQEKHDEINRSSNIIFFGLNEHDNETCKALMMDVFARIMKLNILEENIASCFRLGRRGGNTNRPILVKFSSIHCKELVYSSKKLLKESKIVAREDLTPSKLKILKETLKKVGKNGKVWTNYGNIIVKYNNANEIVKINTMEDVISL